jgi:cysteine desulfurase family protein (TIGR01976 family)
MQRFDVDWVRSMFPSLALQVNGHPAAFLDAPGGTQVPQPVLDAMVRYLTESNSNTHGFFQTSRATDQTIATAREAAADFLHCTPSEVAFGANMTTMTYLLAKAMARHLGPGDEIIITDLDHEANRGPWLDLRRRGIVVRKVPVDTATCTLDWDAFERLLSERTMVVAVGYASNAVGTVNDVRRAVAMASQVRALSVVDAVHYALHGVVDVRDIGCDVLLCSAYKFFGPHVGVQYVRRDVADELRSLHLRTQGDEPPFKFETGTLNHEGLAGVTAAVDFIAEVGRRHEDWVVSQLGAGVLAAYEGRAREVAVGMLAGELHEQPLALRLRDGLRAIEGVTLYGPPDDHPRTATVSFTLKGMTAQVVAERLGDLGLFVWDGDFYAIRLVERLGLVEQGGLVRVGLAPYTTADEVERVIAAVAGLAAESTPE